MSTKSVDRTRYSGGEGTEVVKGAFQFRQRTGLAALLATPKQP